MTVQLLRSILAELPRDYDLCEVVIDYLGGVRPVCTITGHRTSDTATQPAQLVLGYDLDAWGNEVVTIHTDRRGPREIPDPR